MHSLTATTFDDFIASNPVVLVDFWAAWCGPCKMMNPILTKLSEQHTIAKVNVDEEPELVERFEIRSMPTFLLFRDGKITDRHVGAAGRDAVESWLVA